MNFVLLIYCKLYIVHAMRENKQTWVYTRQSLRIKNNCNLPDIDNIWKMWMHENSKFTKKNNEQTKTQLIWDRIEETKTILSIWTHALVRLHVRM